MYCTSPLRSLTLEEHMSFTSILARRHAASPLLAVALLGIPFGHPLSPAARDTTVVTGRVTDMGGQPLGAASVSIGVRNLTTATRPDEIGRAHV